MSESSIKTKVLNKIDAKLQDLDEKSIRYEVLNSCRKFKTTWIQLGQNLYSVHRDRLYIDWGFESFESYCNVELCIKTNTAMKLLRSYSFLENEAPKYIERAHTQTKEKPNHPDLESVNMLRLAKKSNKIGTSQYERIRDQVLEGKTEPKEVRREIKLLTENVGPSDDPEYIRAKRRDVFVSRLVKSLENAKLEAMASRFLPPKIIDALDELVQQIEKEQARG